MTRGVASLILIGSAFGVFLTYLLSERLLDWRCPWKKQVISAEFDGLLPKEAREMARAAKVHFDKLYLIVDEQHRWKSALLPDPKPRASDPLHIAELRHGRQSNLF